MLDMIDMAKDLIAKGNSLGDSELVAMGMAMLETYKEPDETPDYAVTVTDQAEAFYRCTNCGNEIEYDKPGRKKCSQCKKHKLVLIEATAIEVSNNKARVATEEFFQQIRKPKSTRIRYDDEGKPTGVYTRTEQVEGITNVWNDDDKSEGQDEQNERLKKLTKVSPRTRPPIQFKQMTCEICKNTYSIHPIHVGGRAQFVCDRCVRKRSRL